MLRFATIRVKPGLVTILYIIGVPFCGILQFKMLLHGSSRKETALEDPIWCWRSPLKWPYICTRSKRLLILWLWSSSTVILEPKKIKYVTVSTFFPSICHEVMGSDAMILVLWMLVLSQFSHSLLLPSSRGSLVSLWFLPFRVLNIWGCWCFSQVSWFQLVSHLGWCFAWCTLL